jgi:hypothetical protein
MSTNSNSYPDLDIHKRSKVPHEDIDIERSFDSTFDILFPFFTRDSYRLDVQKIQKMIQRVLSLPPVETPQISDIELFRDIVGQPTPNLIKRGTLVKPTTNLDIQKTLSEQEKDLFPTLVLEKRKRPLSSDAGTTEGGPQSTESTSIPLENRDNIKMINTQITTLINLVKAQSGLFTLVKEVSTELKTLSAEVMNLRSEVTHAVNMQTMLYNKVEQLVLSKPVSTPPPQSAETSPRAEPQDLGVEETEEVKAVKLYYENHLASRNLTGLTKTLFTILVTAKDAYTRAKKMFPGLKLPKENFQCFSLGKYTKTDIDVLNREFSRLSSALHKETYRPPGGTSHSYRQHQC